MIDLIITPDEGDAYPLTVASRDILAWEKVTKNMTFNKLQQDMNMTHLYNLAHRAATRKHIFTGTLADFEESHDLDIVDPTKQDDDEEGSGSADPTNTGA